MLARNRRVRPACSMEIEKSKFFRSPRRPRSAQASSSVDVRGYAARVLSGVQILSPDQRDRQHLVVEVRFNTVDVADSPFGLAP